MERISLCTGDGLIRSEHCMGGRVWEEEEGVGGEEEEEGGGGGGGRVNVIG